MLTVQSKLETKIVLIDEKNCKDFLIYFTRYGHEKSIRLFNFDYYKLIENISKFEEKKCLMVDDQNCIS